MQSRYLPLSSKLLNGLLFFVFLMICGCEAENEPASDRPTQTVQQLIAEQSNLSTFAAALARIPAENLNNPNLIFTVFAPSNQAFSEYFQAQGWATLAEVPDETLLDLLRYHIVLGQKLASNTSILGQQPNSQTDSATTITSRNNKQIFVYKSGNSLTLNHRAALQNTNLLASNGVVHIIDEVLPVPAQRLGEFISANTEQFSLLQLALERSQLLPYLNDEQSFTLFAPTDAAFEGTTGYSTAEEIAGAEPAELQRILLYHLLPHHRFSTMFRQDTVLTPLGQSLILNGATKTVKGQGNESPANLIEDWHDLLMANGVLHVIDAVLLPKPEGE